MVAYYLREEDGEFAWPLARVGKQIFAAEEGNRQESVKHVQKERVKQGTNE